MSESEIKEEERAAAAALARGLDAGETAADSELGELLRVAGRARAAAGLAHPLEPARREALVGEVIASVAQAPSRPRRRLVLVGAIAAALLVALGLVALLLARPKVTPPAVQIAQSDSRAAPTDALFDGPFPEDQRPSERMDRIVAARTRGYFSAQIAARARRVEPAAAAVSRSPFLSLDLALFSLAAIAGCAAEEPAQQRPPQIDEQLLAALGLAQSYQHQADELAELGELDEAIGRVRRVLTIGFPEAAPEAEDVRLDAWGRIAELQLEAGELDAADRSVNRGLAEATRVSYFKARLFNVKGRVLRQRARELRQAGEVEASRQASRAAIAAFEQSIALNQQVLGLDDHDDAGAASDGGR